MASPLKFFGKFCYLADTIGAGGGAFDSVITRIRSGWCKIVPLIAGRSRLYYAIVYSIMLYASETWPVKEEDLIRLEKNDARIVRWVCNVRSEDSISAEELRTRLKLKSTRECFQNRRLQWSDHLERMAESA